MIIFNGLTIDYSPQNSGFEKRIESIKISENWNVLMFVTKISSQDIRTTISLHFLFKFHFKNAIGSFLFWGMVLTCFRRCVVLIAGIWHTHRHMTAGHAGTTHNYFISHFHTLGKFSFLDSLSALKNPVFVLKIFKILKILISVINIWKLWTKAATHEAQ